MAKIISIQCEEIKIGTDDGSIKTVKKENLNFNPKIGDIVEIFEKENEVLVILKNNNEENSKKGNIFAIISLLLTYGMSAISALFLQNTPHFIDSIVSLFPLSGLVLMIIGRVNFPKNKFLKVLMWIYIINLITLIIYAIIASILLVSSCIACGSECSHMNTTGCY